MRCVRRTAMMSCDVCAVSGQRCSVFGSGGSGRLQMGSRADSNEEVGIGHPAHTGAVHSRISRHKYTLDHPTLMSRPSTATRVSALYVPYDYGV